MANGTGGTGGTDLIDIAKQLAYSKAESTINDWGEGGGGQGGGYGNKEYGSSRFLRTSDPTKIKIEDLLHDKIT